MTTKPSFCRTCHQFCGVIVEVDDDGRAVSMTGDHENPLFQGFSCIKGRAAPQLHNSPDRLLHALKRQPDGSFEHIAVEQAMDEIAVVLRGMIDEHGPGSVACWQMPVPSRSSVDPNVCVNGDVVMPLETGEDSGLDADLERAQGVSLEMPSGDGPVATARMPVTIGARRPKRSDTKEHA